MASINITIADADLSRVVTDVCGFWGYQAVLTDMLGNQTPNPETPNQFARRMVIQTVKGWCKTYEQQQAATTAATSAGAAADGLGIN